MDTFYMVTIFILGFSLVYMLIKNQIFKVLQEKIHELYKDQIESDIQDIYREFESYSAIIDSRINRLKTLTERQEASVKAWEDIQSEIKKAKAGKEVLNYIENRKSEPLVSAEEIAAIKKEITDELKKYLSLKLNLESTLKTKEKTPPVRMSKEAFTPELSRPVAAPIPEKPLKSERIDMAESDDFNAAEMIVDDLIQENHQPPRSMQIKSVALKQTIQEDEDGASEDSKILSTLASIGKTLAPIFIKQDKPVSSVPEPRPVKKPGNFNDLIRKEATLSEGKPAQAVASPAAEQNQDVIKEEKVTLKTNLSPDALVKLIESLKNSRSRPDALKSLLGQGFDLNQIAELSSIPYSDLELTKNLYKI